MTAATQPAPVATAVHLIAAKAIANASRPVLYTGGGVVKAQPSALSASGSAFTATWKHS